MHSCTLPLRRWKSQTIKTGNCYIRCNGSRAVSSSGKYHKKGLAEITVLDNLVFCFSFQFQIPTAGEFHDGKMLCLPRPLDCGRLYVDNEKLLLSFRIDAPDPTLRVEVTHMYQGILSLDRYCTPLCGQTL